MSDTIKRHVDDINEAVKLPWDRQQERLSEIIANIYRVNAGDAHGACITVWERIHENLDHEERDTPRSEGIEHGCEMCADAAHKRVLRDVPDWP